MQDKVVVITGASAGVGRAVAREFGRRRARVALLARGVGRLEAAQQEIETAGGQALVVPTDVADPEAVEAAADRVERELGPIDVWVNNAMATVYAPALRIEPEEFRRVTSVTYLGAVYGTLAALHRMVPRDRGHIVQVGSALAYRAIPLQSAYCGAKHGLRGFTDSLRSELIHNGSNVQLTMVHLPAMNTPQFQWGRAKLPTEPQPVPPIYQPETAAQAIVRAVDRNARELLVGFPTVKAVLGSKVLPGFLDRYLARAAYSGQKTDVPIAKDREDNLFAPAHGDYAAHGHFDDRARGDAIVMTHRQTLALAGLTVATIAAALGGVAGALLF